MAELLISFCRPARPGAVFARFDFETGALRWIATPSLPEGTSGMGLAQRGRDVYALTMHLQGCRLFRFDHTLALRRCWPLRLVALGHALVDHADGMLANSTGTDALVRIDVDGDGDGDVEETVVWSTGAGTDQRHVNGVATEGDRVFVSAFGRRRNGSWADTEGGYVHDVVNGRDRCTGLLQPHSLFHLDGRLCVLESIGGRILDVSGRSPVCIGKVDGYARGIATSASSLYVATSRSRRRSTRTGDERDVVPRSRCEIHRIDRQTGEVTVRPLYRHGAEIFDLLLLPGEAGTQ